MLRHGQSEWNKENRFTGWHDSPLSKMGREEAKSAGRLLAEKELIPKKIYTSYLSRAIQTTEEVLAELQQSSKTPPPAIPVIKAWQLNERHYGDLTGLDKKQAVKDFGEEQVFAWRRQYNVRPPEITEQNPYFEGIAQQHSDLVPKHLPKTECLADVLHRLLPFWKSDIAPTLAENETLLVSAHGNSLRALVKFLDEISDEEISQLNIPTGIPLIYEMGYEMDYETAHDKDNALQPTERLPLQELEKRFLGDPEAIKAAARKVAEQTSLKN